MMSVYLALCTSTKISKANEFVIQGGKLLATCNLFINYNSIIQTDNIKYFSSEVILLIVD